VKYQRKVLKALGNPTTAVTHRSYFKNSKNDEFWGVPATALRKVAAHFRDISLIQIKMLKESRVHDERSLAHAILCLKYKTASSGKDFVDEQKKIFNFHIRHRRTIRDWSGVDDSAPYIVGHFLLERDKAPLFKLAQSRNIWDRRIAIVATWWFIRNKKIEPTLKIAKLLLKDEEDLIHKAVGWMLREVGKKNAKALEKFLDVNIRAMPRTTLRYAIERYSIEKRAMYLKK